jgi:hypothetical protein
MNRFAFAPTDERARILAEAALNRGLNAAIIEKDFWICWLLDYLFSKSPVQNQIVFKGGTSLSKGYDLIRRMSEDIDIVIDWRLLGYDVDEPWQKRSNKKQKAFIAEIRARAASFLASTLLPQMKSDFADYGFDASAVRIDSSDLQTILFTYPQAFSDDALLQEVRIEVGAMSAWTPTRKLKISSYVQQEFPSNIKSHPIQVVAVLPERTFWEKTTILHKEAHRLEGSVPPRYSRHYYDVYELSRSTVLEEAFKNTALLEKVVAFNKHFYRSAFAHYELAKPGSFKLLPPGDSLALLEQDYAKMRPLIYGDYPTFEIIIASLAELEDKINAL